MVYDLRSLTHVHNIMLYNFTTSIYKSTIKYLIMQFTLNRHAVPVGRTRGDLNVKIIDVDYIADVTIQVA